MTVINGNIRYFSYYKNIEELRKDTNVRSGKLVSVISMNNIDVDYVISETLGDNGVKLDNGLYANPIYNGNSLGSGVSQVYSSIRPSDYNVGGINKGDEFNAVPLTDVINKMINGTETISATMDDGASSEIIYRRGDLLQINGVTIDILSTYYSVVKVIVYNNEEIVKEVDCEVTFGHINIPCSISLRDTAEVSVKIIDEKDNAIRLSMIHHFEEPVYCTKVSYGDTPGIGILSTAVPFYGTDPIDITETFSAQSLLVIVPQSKRLKHLYDENNLISDGIWERQYDIPYSTSEYSTVFRFYLTSSLSVSDFTFRVEVE